MVFLMLASITLNYIFGLLVHWTRNKKRVAKTILIIMVIINIGLLFVFKYLVFTVESINSFGGQLAVPSIALPIGISFFTFQAISYVVDVYRGDGEVQKNPFNTALYISFFPQLIAGPIVRYSTFQKQINERKESIDK
ncbi:MAG: MBOAT family protein, partial [Lachnotalea sp.]